MINRKALVFKTVFCGERFQCTDRLFPISGVVIYEVDLFTFQVTHAAFLISDVLHQRGGLAPVGCREVEDPGKHFSVRGGCSPVAHGENRNFIHGGLRYQLIGDTRRERLHHQRTRRRRVLDIFIALNTFCGVVARFTSRQLDLDAFHTAVTLIKKRKVIGHGVRQRNTVWRIRPRSILQCRNDKLIGLRIGCHRRQCQHGCHCSAGKFSKIHQ